MTDAARPEGFTTSGGEVLTVRSIAQAIADMVETARQAGYDGGYQDAASLACLSCGRSTHEFGEQGDLGGRADRVA